MNNRELKNHSEQERPFVRGVDLLELDERHQGIDWTGPVEEVQGVERNYQAVFVSGEYTGDTHVHELPVLEVFTDTQRDGTEIGRREVQYAQLPDGRVLPQEVSVVFQDGETTRQQGIKRTFERLADGSMRVKAEVLTVDGVTRRERTYADPEDYKGGEFLVDYMYDEHGDWERTVSFWRAADADHWQRAVDSPDAQRTQEQPRFEVSLEGPSGVRGIKENLPEFLLPPEMPRYEQQPVVQEAANELVFEEVQEAA